MKNKLTLVIMAAGLGSRYGGMKQVDTIDDVGNLIIDYSIYDAIRAGFDRVIFIIKEENRELFEQSIGNRVAEHIEVEYVYQDINNLPEGYEVPEGRVKPWGTGHAVLSCIDVIDGPFAVINADDFYGEESFRLLSSFFQEGTESDDWYMLVGYRLENTLSDYGSVARGICTVDEHDVLVGVTERTQIVKTVDGIMYSEDDDETSCSLEPDQIVSMNMWAFRPSFVKELEAGFPKALDVILKENPLKGEFYLPSMVSDIINRRKDAVKVACTGAKWYGVTYAEDKPQVVEAIREMKRRGEYPETLWKSTNR